MHTLPKHMLFYAASLAALAGCVDAIGFMQLRGYFVSFMSGNSTRLAIGLWNGDTIAITILLSIIVCFVTGAAVGAAIRSLSVTQKKQAAILTLVALLLAIAALCDSSGAHTVSMLTIALAMGAENSVLQSDEDNVIGVTYMTGTLVKMGQRITAALLGKGRYSWIPYLLLWLSLMLGGITGGALFFHFSFNALWFPAAWAALIAALMWR